MKELRFSDNYLIKRGWYWDLGDEGDFEHASEIEWDEEDNSFIISGTYSWKGWTFSNCEIFARLEQEPEGEPIWAEDVTELPWDTWTVEPTPETEVLEVGEEGVLEGTNFEKFAKIK